MKTKLLKRLRKQARRTYYIEVKSNKQEWNIELRQVKCGYMTTTVTLESHFGYTKQCDKFEFILDQVKHRCDRERRLYILKQISIKRCKQTKTKRAY